MATAMADGVPASDAMFSLSDVSKKFGTLTACDAVNLDIFAGEVLALLGENGAGKSTLMKTLFGVYTPDSGSILHNGAPLRFAQPRDAIAAGIGMVFQTFALIPALSVRDNLLMAWPKTPFLIGGGSKVAAGALATLRRLAPDIRPGTLVGDLSVGEQQLVELCRVLNTSAQLVILDEPTSVLTPAEAKRLYGFIADLAGSGVAVVLITHKLADVAACADRVVIMRRGQIVDTAPVTDRSADAIVAAMVGPENVLPPLDKPARSATTVPRLQLNGVNANVGDHAIHDLSLDVHGGEIVGVAGVTGNGQSVLAEAIAAVCSLDSGEIALDGTSIARHKRHGAMTVQLGYVPEQPRFNAIVEGLDVTANLALRTIADKARHPAGKTRLRMARDKIARYDIRPTDPERDVGTLSGGNLQKLVLARETADQGAILLAYPTMGLDVSAARAVYERMLASAFAGAAILWICEDLDDLLAIADRIAVMRGGRIVGVVANDGTVTREQLGALMAGSGH